MPKIIDPRSPLSPEDTQQLFDFFEAQSKLGILAWRKTKTYTLADGTPFQFSHNAVQRKCKEGKAGVRYEFASDKILGKGRFSAIYEIDGTLRIEPGSMHYKPAGYKNKTRAIKVQVHSDRDYPVTQAINEYRLSQAAAHLAVKEPTIQGIRSFSVMKKLPGEELFVIIKTNKPLTLQQRVDLSKALLNALKHQVTDKKIIHRDLKPENILVDLTDPITVNIIDFGLSIQEDATDRLRPGTPPYTAPEIFQGLPATVKSDVFSMARILALIWHVSTQSYTLRTIPAFAENANNVDLSSLFIGLTTEVSSENQTIIRNTLAGMMRKEAAARLSIDEAIAGFDQVVISRPRRTHSFFGPETAAKVEQPPEDRQVLST